MNFKKWVKSIQTAGYNGARTVSKEKLLRVVIWHLSFGDWSQSEKLSEIRPPRVCLVNILWRFKPSPNPLPRRHSFWTAPYIVQ